MRLLNTTTGEFKDFFSDAIPEYAILSHLWGNTEDEVSYKQFRKRSVPQDLPGMVKIGNFCNLAATNGFQWAWIDTCCIDKRSSAELSEAINSMYKWYERSEVCIVYLADVEFSARELSLKNQAGDAFWSSFKEKFRKSFWFKRGWTLQELVAPKIVVFYDARWREIGALHVEKICNEVVEVTGIGAQWLGPSRDRPQWASIAARMSWASRRKTSREEDMAYCLLGLFAVNMPLLYGEGAEKAFYRLQTEIMKVTDDESLFAWTHARPASMFEWTLPRLAPCLLAASPEYFADSGDICARTSLFANRPSFSKTNKGLDMAVPTIHLPGLHECGKIPLFLQCSRGDGQALYVELHVDRRQRRERATRVNCSTLKVADTSSDGRKYLINDFQKDLTHTERIYIT